MNIYKILVHETGTLTTHVDPRIYWSFPQAYKDAQEYLDEGFWDDKEIDGVNICNEVPDNLGFFRTKELIKVTTSNTK